MPEKNKTTIVLDVDPDVEEDHEVFPSLLDKWRLKVLDEQGEQIGDDFGHCYEQFVFTLSDINKTFRLDLADEKRDNTFFRESITSPTQEKVPDLEFSKEEVIEAKLTPYARHHAPTFRLFESQNEVKDICLEIREGERDFCWTKVIPAFETDFDSYSDLLLVNLRLSPARFRNLCELLTKESGGSDAQLALKNCAGFYSQIGYGDVSHVEILLNDEHHPVLNVPEGYRVPRVGLIGKFSIFLPQTFSADEEESEVAPKKNPDLMEIKESLRSIEEYTTEKNRRLGVTNGLLVVLVLVGFAILFGG